MASDRTKRGMDKSTRDAVSGLQWALENIAPNTIQPDEFTAAMLWEAQPKESRRTYDSIRHFLDRRVQSGELTMRKVLNKNGKYENAYRKA